MSAAIRPINKSHKSLIDYRIVARKAFQISTPHICPHDLSSENNYALFKNMSSAKLKIIELTLMNLNQTKNDGGR